MNWYEFREGGVPVTDHEGNTDPSTGGASVHKTEIDIASCSADDINPGTAASAFWVYYDGGTPYVPATPSTMDDDFLAFRVRLDGDPRDNGLVGYKKYAWSLLIDIDGDGFREFVLSVDGNETTSAADLLYVFYSNTAGNDVSTSTDTVDTFVAASDNGTQTYNHVRAVQDSSMSCNGTNDYWLDFQVPMAALDNTSGVQQLFPDTQLNVVFATAGATSNPLQRDMSIAPGTTTPLTTAINMGDTFTSEGGATLIDLVSFTAGGLKNHAVLNWETAAETDTAGFHLWRADAWSNGYTRLTDTMIPAEGGITWGADYEFEDSEVRTGTTYFYKLEDVDFGGFGGLHGPARATVGRADIILQSPGGKSGVSMTRPPNFVWKSNGASRFRLQFSRDPDFSGTVISLPDQCGIGPGWITGESYTPASMIWQSLWDLPPLRRGLYWRVVGRNAAGEPVASAPSSIAAIGQGGGN